jgi:sugar/nucleoside kinase (ribokinase family)
MNSIVIVGGVSFDALLFAGQTVRTVGGAGLYTALGASRAGAPVTLLAPRPAILPPALQPVLNRLEWIGPIVPIDELPQLEIAHHGGGRATLLKAQWGAVSRFTPAAWPLPAPLTRAVLVHVAALPSAQHQLDWLTACRASGTRLISVGTYARLVHGETHVVRTLFARADLFFMNENEANGLFGSLDAAGAAARSAPGKRLFVTLGERGAMAFDGEHVSAIPGVAARELDPTGAGDTFCGATLAGLARGASPVAAATRACQLAARMIEAPGPAFLLGEI